MRKITVSATIQRVFYAVSANVISMIISTLLTVLVPANISPLQYGFWQLFQLYASYFGYLSFGLTDGAYLRYGGVEYKNLPHKVFVSQFWFLVVMNLIFDVGIMALCTLTMVESSRYIVFFFCCVSGVLGVSKSLLIFMLQATGRVREYTVTTLTERIVFFLLVMLVLFLRIDNFVFLLVANVTGQILALVYAVWKCKALVFGKPAPVRETYTEATKNIAVGAKLLFANFASMLILGIVRMGIESHWGVIVFGKISLTLGVSNIIVSTIGSVGMVLFPMLRRIDETQLNPVYQFLNTVILFLTSGGILFYFPIRYVLPMFLPQYADSLAYMGLLFPLCVFECKSVLLLNTYAKALRKENLMLIVNIAAVALSAVLTGITVFLLDNIVLAILSVVCVLAFRSLLLEHFLTKALHIKKTSRRAIEFAMVGIFIICGWFIQNLLLGFTVYAAVYGVFLYFSREQLKHVIKRIRGMVK